MCARVYENISVHGYGLRMRTCRDSFVRFACKAGADDKDDASDDSDDTNTDLEDQIEDQTDQLSRIVKALAALTECSRLEGILPALETAHALHGMKLWAANHPGHHGILCLSGRGDKDMPTLQRSLLEDNA